MQHGITIPPNVRDIGLPPGSGDKPSSFGVLFERDPDHQPDDLVLGLLGRISGQMSDFPGPNQPTDSDGTIPAGFTFFGQFIDHDITLMSAPPALGLPQDLVTVINLRTPKLDLDTVFGKGPADPDSAKFYDPATLKLRLADNGRDIIRTGLGVKPSDKLIPDSRNDQTIILVQLHVLFMKMYNHFISQVPGGRADIGRYEQARLLTVQHYQNIVLKDFLPRIVGPEAVQAAIDRKASRYAAMVENFPTKLIMPVEFSFAAFRFGHSMLRDNYRLQPGALNIVLFNPELGGDLNGGQTIEGPLLIDWNMFFEVAEVDNGSGPADRNISRKFDTRLSPSLLRLRPPAIPNLPLSLAERNLRRGRAFLLPSGQNLAGKIGIDPIPTASLGLAPGLSVVQDALKLEDVPFVDIREHTPLWFYILREAELHGGTQLVGVGAWIVAETLVGFLMNDPDSILNHEFTPDPGLDTMAKIAKMLN